MKTPWLKSAPFDLGLILLPSLFSVLLVSVFAGHLDKTSSIPLWAWLIFVLGVDVSHVYSTLFRTYFNSHEFRENKVLLTVIPLGAWLVGVAIYSAGGWLFWRLLAYLAVFHFIRQQYGFVRLYARGDEQTQFERRLDSLMIAVATLYPILYWHSSETRNFHWFVDGDFMTGLSPMVTSVAGWIYIAVAAVYVARLIGRPFNVPKNLVIAGTCLSWYVGIVLFNGDMIFTITNVVSHGVPYMALVWLYGARQMKRPNAPLIMGRVSYRVFFSWYALPLYVGLLFVFGFFEEGTWAGLVWREHLEFFRPFSSLPHIRSKETLTWLIPLLTLPQATHYVLDGFIWKLKDSDANWQKVLFK